MKRISLLIATKLAIMLVLGISASLPGLNRFLDANGLDFGALLAFAAVIGFGGAFISLLISKPIAKWSVGARVLKQPANEYRADRGAARIMGTPRPMIDALARLGGFAPGVLPKNMAASSIAGAGLLSLFSSHPSCEQRISALQHA